MSKDTDLLQVFDDLPDLLAMANEIQKNEGGYSYEIQDGLREEYRQEGKPFKGSMLYRHIDRCSQCDYHNTAIQHQLENPQINDDRSPLRVVVVWEIAIHEMREHGESMPPELRDFLTQIRQQT